MTGPKLLATFALAFALGVSSAAWIAHRHWAEANDDATSATSTQKDSGADADPATPGSGKDESSADDAPKWPDDAGTPEQVMYQQSQMMDDAIAKLTPRVPGKVNLYLVAFAGDGDENVFRNEVDFVEKQFSQRFDAAGHIITLINNPQTLNRNPLASLSNLDSAIKAVAEKMDVNEDILLLFLTSHGSRDHELYVGMDPLPLDQIDSDDIADALSDTPIRWKVIVISACYSGGFIDALSDSGTMIITAARADRSSFGCGTESEITDFGSAFFVEGMNHNDSFDGAFAQAKQLISQWEERDNETHSEPQFVTTPQIDARLKQWRAGLKLGPPVPFGSNTSKPRRAPGSFTAARYAQR